MVGRAHISKKKKGVYATASHFPFEMLQTLICCFLIFVPSAV